MPPLSLDTAGRMVNAAVATQGTHARTEHQGLRPHASRLEAIRDVADPAAHDPKHVAERLVPKGGRIWDPLPSGHIRVRGVNRLVWQIEPERRIDRMLLDDGHGPLRVVVGRVVHVLRLHQPGRHIGPEVVEALGWLPRAVVGRREVFTEAVVLLPAQVANVGVPASRKWKVIDSLVAQMALSKPNM